MLQLSSGLLQLMMTTLTAILPQKAAILGDRMDDNMCKLV